MIRKNKNKLLFCWRALLHTASIALLSFLGETSLPWESDVLSEVHYSSRGLNADDVTLCKALWGNLWIWADEVMGSLVQCFWKIAPHKGGQIKTSQNLLLWFILMFLSDPQLNESMMLNCWSNPADNINLLSLLLEVTVEAAIRSRPLQECSGYYITYMYYKQRVRAVISRLKPLHTLPHPDFKPERPHTQSRDNASPPSPGEPPQKKPPAVPPHFSPYLGLHVHGGRVELARLPDGVQPPAAAPRWRSIQAVEHSFLDHEQQASGCHDHQER